MYFFRHHGSSLSLFFCLLVAAIGNGNVLACITHDPGDENTRLQLFHCLDSALATGIADYPGSLPANPKIIETNRGSPFCIDVHFDLSRKTLLLRHHLQRQVAVDPFTFSAAALSVFPLITAGEYRPHTPLRIKSPCTARTLPLLRTIILQI